MSSRPISGANFRKTWNPFLLTAGSLILLLVVSLLYEKIYGNFLEGGWEKFSSEKEQRLSEEIQSKFSEYQSRTSRAIGLVISQTSLREVLANSPDTSSSVFFEILISYVKPDLSLELFSAQRRTLSWAGNRGPLIDSSCLLKKTTTFVLQGPIYTYLVVSVPVARGSDTCGYLVGKRLFDVNYPINNRFISSGAFASTFTSRLGYKADFNFSQGARPSPEQLSVPLKGIDGSLLGFAYFQKPSLSGRLEELHEDVRRVDTLIFVLLAALALYLFGKFQAAYGTGLRIIFGWTILLWLIRYLLIWLDFPSSVIRIGIFSPSYFASPFGFGIARSLGDVCLSAWFLFSNLLLIIYPLIRRPNPRLTADASVPEKNRILNALWAGAAAFLILILTRAFAATLRAAVFDSALPYNDPTTVIPSFELSIMLLSLLLVALSFVIASAAMVTVMNSFLEGVFTMKPSRATAWLASAAVLSVSSFLFGILVASPLLGQFARIVYLMVCTLLAILFALYRESGFAGRALKLWTAAIISALIILLPLLKEETLKFDRSHVELLSDEIVRPEDSWLTFLANKALDELSGSEAARIMASRDTDDIEKLAFTQWAKSILSREGNNCSVTFVSRDGRILADFHIGTPAYRTRQLFEEAPAPYRSVHTEARNQNGGTVKWCTGYAPVSGDDGFLLGGVWVEISGGRQVLLGDEAPDLLRNYTKENFQSHYRKLIFSEYYQGFLTYTTNEDFPKLRPLPREILKNTAENGVWLDDEIDGKVYETYFLREQRGQPEDSWIGVSMAALDVRWYLYTFLRYILFYMIVSSAAAFLYIAVKFLRGRRPSPSFRAQLMASFVVVSLLPVAILAYYNRQYATERAQDAALKSLSEQTSIIVAEIQRQVGLNVPAALAGLTDERCQAVANDLNTDFNVYFGSRFQASSKPEMFTAELLDQTLSAQAFLNVVLRKKEFFSENLAIGKLPYVVGYRPLVAENGLVIGVVSVPTLYRQIDIDEELARRNVFLYGSYAIALALSVLVGTFFAGQISSPVRRLKSAARQIASGELDVDLKSSGAGELMELEQAFRQMALDLKETQGQMIKTNRELAWKEMAKQVAHEIKNPLTPIKLSIQHLRRAYADGVKDFGKILDQVSNTVLEQIEALSRIASEFSRFGRMPERKMELCRLNEVLMEARNLFHKQGRIEFADKFDPHDPLVRADREELRRAFINIIRNSVQAMGESGRITLYTELKGSTAEVHISDTGPGIAPDAMEHLFEPNFSTKTDGMGMGLAIVKKIINDLDGTVSIQSTPLSGTRALITLPLAIDEES